MPAPPTSAFSHIFLNPVIADRGMAVPRGVGLRVAGG
jgi:hypothetical protein